MPAQLNKYKNKMTVCSGYIFFFWGAASQLEIVYLLARINWYLLAMLNTAYNHPTLPHVGMMNDYETSAMNSPNTDSQDKNGITACDLRADHEHAECVNRCKQFVSK